MNKKGATLDNIYVLVTFFMVVVFFIALIIFWNRVSDITQVWNSNDQTRVIRSNTQAFFNQIDFILVMVWLALHIGVVVTSYLLNSHPIMFVVTLIVCVILVIISVPISNTWESVVSTDANISAEVGEIPITNHILLRLPIYELLWAFLTMIAMVGLGGGRY